MERDVNLVFRMSLSGVILLGLLSQTVAQPATPPPNTVACDAFTKRPDGSWHVENEVTIQIGDAASITLDHTDILPRLFMFGEIDLYALLEQKCRKPV